MSTSDQLAIDSKTCLPLSSWNISLHVADGIALGAAASASKTDVEFVIFLAIMLHKAPAAFGLTSFLLHEVCTAVFVVYYT